MYNWRTAIDAALQPSRFFVVGQGSLQVVYRSCQEIAWDIYRGHLLDESRTRQHRRFEAWDIVADLMTAPSCEPWLSVKHAHDENRLYVVRYLQLYRWQAYEVSPGVIESRPTQNPTPELVGAIDLGQHTSARSLQAELATYVYLALVGTSRLPITSLESPLPAFSLGELMYLPHGGGSREPLRDPKALLALASSHDLRGPQKAKLVEGALRAVDPADVPRLAEALINAWSHLPQSEARIVALLRTLLNELALSPYTDFVTKFISLLNELASPKYLGTKRIVDVVSYLLRYLTRHLTAYDLITFHNLGANYPDALLLDAALTTYLRLVEQWPQHFATIQDDDRHTARHKRMRRRALRQGCLLREAYEGHRVPDVPTSRGENQRVLPDPYVRVPDEQITKPQSRRKQLYADQPLQSLLTKTTGHVLRQSIDDLAHCSERRELGTAIYLDRPLGIFKQPGEVDRTPLLSYESFSRRIATCRLRQLYRLGWIENAVRLEWLENKIGTATVFGCPATMFSGPQRPGVVSLEDARVAADDFLFMRTSRRSLKEFLSACDWNPVENVDWETMKWLRSDRSVLLIRTAMAEEAACGKPLLTVYDPRMQPRVELSLTAAVAPRYRESCGVEHLEGGLRVTGVWKETPISRDIEDDSPPP